MTRGVAVGLFAVLLASVTACQIIGGFDDIHGAERTHASAGGALGKPDGADGLDGSGGGSLGGGGLAGCGQNGERVRFSHGPAMIQVVASDRCLWIDETEVTRAAYAEFLRSGARASSGVCDFDVDRSVDPACLGLDAGLPEDDVPITCVDWCDAAAFCEWTGKRLCEGNYLLSVGAAERGEWNFACSFDGKFLYPYAGNFSSLACNGKDNPASGCGAGSCSLWPAGASTTCVTTSGVEDLAGNAAEWTGECGSVVGPSDQCNTFGGDIDTANAGCGSKVSRSRTYKSPLLGFRCCAPVGSVDAGND